MMNFELEEGIPIFLASHFVQERIKALLSKQKLMPLSPEEEQELDDYEAIDDHLSFVNRMLRNLSLAEGGVIKSGRKELKDLKS